MIFNLLKGSKKNQQTAALTKKQKQAQQKKQNSFKSARLEHYLNGADLDVSCEDDDIDTVLASNDFTIVVPNDWEDSQDEPEYLQEQEQQQNDAVQSSSSEEELTCENNDGENLHFPSELWTSDFDKETALRIIRERIQEQETILTQLKDSIHKKILEVATRLESGRASLSVVCAMTQVLDLEAKRDRAFQRFELLEELRDDIVAKTAKKAEFPSKLNAILSIPLLSHDLSQAEILDEAETRVAAHSVVLFEI